MSDQRKVLEDFPDAALERQMIRDAQEAGGDVECHVKELLGEIENLRNQRGLLTASLKILIQSMEHVRSRLRPSRDSVSRIAVEFIGEILQMVKDDGKSSTK